MHGNAQIAPATFPDMFLVPKPGHNQWRLIIDMRDLNRYCSEFTMTCETLKHLRHLSRPGDYIVSLDLTDGYYTLGIREEDRDYFTVNNCGALWRLACLPMGWSGSAYYFLQTHSILYELPLPPYTAYTRDYTCQWTPFQAFSPKRHVARYSNAPLHGRLSLSSGFLQRRGGPSPTRQSSTQSHRPPAEPEERCLDAYTSWRPLGLNS
jgi:hypothetical protein